MKLSWIINPWLLVRDLLEDDMTANWGLCSRNEAFHLTQRTRINASLNAERNWT